MGSLVPNSTAVSNIQSKEESDQIFWSLTAQAAGSGRGELSVSRRSNHLPYACVGYEMAGPPLTASNIAHEDPEKEGVSCAIEIAERVLEACKLDQMRHC